MISFESDYIAGAHPEILCRLQETNMESLSGYGTDPYSERAKRKICDAISMPDAQVEFLVGGTQTNSVVISAMLADYEGVIAAGTGHISTHEAGAIEFGGHKVLVLENSCEANNGQNREEHAGDNRTENTGRGREENTGRGSEENPGKISPEALARYLSDFYADETHEHMVFPGMVYISYPTEYGTLYSKKELEQISGICRKYQIPLYIDGARLGYGLMSRQSDLTMAEIARLCDVFYIGGTKVGALCGEAVVFTKGNRPPHFMTSMKRRGALLAKGRLLGVQFDTLFTDDLYLRISRHAIDMAERMKEIFRAHDLTFAIDSPTNQQFVILENEYLEKIRSEVAFSFWEKYDETHTVVRFATSWSTSEEDLEKLDEIL